jgi:hypothetical protein
VTERDWLACAEPCDLLTFVGSRLSNRKELLFVVACCRKVWQPPQAEVKADLQRLEWFADGQTSREDLERLTPWLRWLVSRLGGLAADYAQDWAARSGEHQYAADLVRDLFNPFRPVPLDPAWLAWHDGLVIRLAQAAYQERHQPASTLDNARLAVLADALEEAGCTDPDILNHCRRSGVHVRGCWAVDLLLGKV